MNDGQLLRYSRHILLDEIGIEGQEKLLASHALIVGAGGLGSPVALYLASAGVGRITVVDHDIVDATNLQRQIAHTQNRLGQPKAVSAQAAMHAINPDVCITPLVQRADDALLHALLPHVQVVLDCCDNFATRHAINRACMRHRVPLVSGAVTRFAGQLSVFDPRLPASPCYACVFPNVDGLPDTPCATLGVFAPLVGVVGALQAGEALKLLAGMNTGQGAGALRRIDGRTLQWSEVQLSRLPDCPVCGFADASRPSNAHSSTL